MDKAVGRNRIARTARWPRQAALLCWVAVLSFHLPSATTAAEPRPVVQIVIEDADSGLSVQAKRTVASGTTGLDALKATVALELKDYPGLGARVLKICDVAPARGKYWALYVDGKYADAGIAGLKVTKNVQIHWKTQQ